jgi:hypothetical protein
MIGAGAAWDVALIVNEKEGAALFAMATVAVLLPAAVGLKVRTKSELAPAATEAAGAVVKLNSPAFVPLRVTDIPVKSAVPPFLMVTVVIEGDPMTAEFPVAVSPAFIVTAPITTSSVAIGVSVGVGDGVGAGVGVGPTGFGQPVTAMMRNRITRTIPSPESVFTAISLCEENLASPGRGIIACIIEASEAIDISKICAYFYNI